jgi:Uma2 family endonuclease
MAATALIELTTMKKSSPEEPLYEVVNGQRVMLPPMGAYPTEVASLLGQYLGPFVTQNQLGKVVVEMLFVIDARTGLERRPDVAFISFARWPMWHRSPSSAAWDVVPNLMVEAVGFSDRAEDLLKKIYEYFQAGAQLVWAIYPEMDIVHVYESFTSIRVLTWGDELEGGVVVSGFCPFPWRHCSWRSPSESARPGGPARWRAHSGAGTSRVNGPFGPS